MIRFSHIDNSWQIAHPYKSGGYSSWIDCTVAGARWYFDKYYHLIPS